MQIVDRVLGSYSKFRIFANAHFLYRRILFIASSRYISYILITTFSLLISSKLLVLVRIKYTLLHKVGKERALGYDPCCVRYFSGGEYLLVSGSNRAACLYTRDGIFLGEVAEHQSWVWGCAPKPDSNYVVSGHKLFIKFFIKTIKLNLT